MEWRLFVPVISTENHLLRAQYQRLQNWINEIIPVEDSESRSDVYFVLSHAFGMKYRHGKKLELKVKLSPSSQRFGIEQWEKYKLGKAEIEQQIDNIVALLLRCGYPQQEQHNFRDLIRRGKTLEIRKCRKGAMVDSVSVEACTLNVKEQTWLSLAVESFSAKDIEQFLMNHVIMHNILDCLREMIAVASTEERRSLGILVCGYPFWVQFVSRESNEDETRNAYAPLRELFLLKGIQIDSF